MVKQLLINGAVNRYALSNRARQAIAFQYITDTQTLRLIDTYNNVALDLVANGDNSLTSSAMQRVWQYIQSKVDAKTGGAFHFRGTLDSLEALSSLTNSAKPGDVYQVTVETYMYDPKTGDVIPSTVQQNDVEYALAEKTDPNTGLVIGRQWVELGFNMDSAAGVTEQWVKDYFVGQWQQKEVLAGISAHTQLSTQLATYEELMSTQVIFDYKLNETKNDLLSTINTTATGLSTYIDNTAASISSWVENVVSASITQYVNQQVSTLSTAISALNDFVVEQDGALSAAIDNLSAYVDTQDEALSGAITDNYNYMINRMDNVSGGFLTRDQGDTIVNNIMNQHVQDLSFILYKDDGTRVN